MSGVARHPIAGTVDGLPADLVVGCQIVSEPALAADRFEAGSSASIVAPRRSREFEKSLGRRSGVSSTHGSITYCHRGMRHMGQWTIEGLTMTMTCGFGTFKVSAGQGTPQKLARNLLRSACKRSDNSASASQQP